MRTSGAALPATLVLLLVGLGAGCRSTDSMLRDMKWGEEFDGDFDLIRDQTERVLKRHFPKGLDPDESDPEKGDFYTVWDYDISMWNRETSRSRAHVKIEDLGEGKLRVGVAVVRQINNNIDNPHEIDEAIWVRKRRDEERELVIENTIVRRYLEAKPSEQFEERYRYRDPGELRTDIIDRNKDVDMGDDGVMSDIEDLPSVTENESKRSKP